MLAGDIASKYFRGILFCNGPVAFRNGVVRPLFEDRNVHLRNSDL